MIFSFIISLSLFLFSGGSLNQAVDNYLKEKLSSYDKYEFEIMNYPDGNVTLEDDPGFKISGNFIYIPVDVVYKNSTESRTYLTIKVKLFKNVLVASENISAKELLDTSDVLIQLKDVTNFRGNPLSSLNEISGVRSKIFIKRGSVLSSEFIEPEPVVKNGDKVTAISKAGNVIVSTKAEAKQEGITGEVIRIVTKDKKQLKAKIIDSQNVLITD